MKILHTADWHLGDRLGRIDRTDDLRRAVERVAALCAEHAVDVLLVAGDLFSELSRPDNLRESIEHLQATFERFLLDGGTILALTGNHDNENFCQTLRLVMTLAAPAFSKAGDLIPAGRLYLATNPTFVRLADKNGGQVQFQLMPYPTPPRYLLDEESQRFASVEEKNQRLQTAYTQKTHELQKDPRFDPTLPTVLAAHIHVTGALLPNAFRMSDQESIVFTDTDLPGSVAYVALGHIHQPQAIGGRAHVRYSGSIEKLDLGEQRDNKSVTIFDLGPAGLVGEPLLLPLPSTPIYAVDLDFLGREVESELAALRERYPDAAQDLVSINFRYEAGKHNLDRIVAELEDLFPRWYTRAWTEASALGPSVTTEDAHRGKSWQETVRDYLRQELVNHPEAQRNAVLARAETLLSREVT
jgi:exonuclease SbcD